MDPELGGGAVFDIGGYPLSLAFLVAAAARGADRPQACDLDPEVVSASGLRVVTEVDGEAGIQLRFADDLVASLRVSILRDIPRETRIECAEGNLLIEDPFLPLEGRRGKTGKLTIERAGEKTTEEIVAPCEVFAAEAFELARMVEEKDLVPRAPLVHATESVALARLAERWLAAF